MELCDTHQDIQVILLDICCPLHCLQGLIVGFSPCIICAQIHQGHRVFNGRKISCLQIGFFSLFPFSTAFVKTGEDGKALVFGTGSPDHFFEFCLGLVPLTFSAIKAR